MNSKAPEETAVRESRRLEIAASILAASLTAHGWAIGKSECHDRARWALEMADALIEEAGRR